MKQVRRAVLMATLGQYINIVISFTLIAVISRMLTPAEIGLSVIGLSITTMMFSLREFVTSDFLIQLDTVERQDVCTARTVVVCFSAFLGLALFLATPALARFYDSETLKLFLGLTIAAAVIESLAATNISLIRRDMQFGTIALIDTTRLVVNAATTISLGMLGWGVISFALAALAASTAATAFALLSRQVWWSFIPSLKSIQSLTQFGRYKGATSVLDRFYDALPMVMLGGLMSSASVGQYNRSVTISNLPDRLVLSSVFSVAFPALAAGVRNKLDIRHSYLRALSFITVVYWPAQLMVVIIAGPVVHLILGNGWDDVVPLARLLTLSSLFFFPIVLTYPLLIALSANRAAFAFNMISRLSAAGILFVAAFFGVLAMAASQFVSLPLQMILSFFFVRRYVDFRWSDLLGAILPSGLVSLAAVAGPLALAAVLGFRFDFTLTETILACVLAVAGWLIGLKTTQHPFLDEINSVAGGIVHRIRARRPFFLRSAQ